MAWTREEMAARRREGAEGRLLRQSRHRHPHPRLELHPEGISVALQSENGMMGMGPFPYEARKTRISSMPASRQ